MDDTRVRDVEGATTFARKHVQHLLDISVFEVAENESEEDKLISEYTVDNHLPQVRDWIPSLLSWATHRGFYVSIEKSHSQVPTFVPSFREHRPRNMKKVDTV